ncbi:MAG: hypothetical protein AB2A00_30545 [Myxococcota bacterium]
METQTEAPSEQAAPPATAGQVVMAALVGVGLALVLIIPPPIHIITGPLGPLIGGMLAGSRVRARSGHAALIGAVMGVLVATGVGLVGAVVLSRVAPTEGGDGGILSRLREPPVMAGVLMGVWLYTTVLGFLGALLGGFIKRST